VRKSPTPGFQVPATSCSNRAAEVFSTQSAFSGLPGVTSQLDGSSVTAYQKLVYAAGSTSLTATLGVENTWTVEDSSTVDFRERLARPVAA